MRESRKPASRKDSTKELEFNESGLVRRLGPGIWNKLTAIISTLVGTAILSTLYFTWDRINGYVGGSIQNYIIDTVSQQIGDKRLKDGIITIIKEERKSDVGEKEIADIIDQERKSEAGALTAGSFNLTPHDPTYKLYIYCPPQHSGSVYVELSEVTKKRYVQVQTEKDPLKTLKQVDTVPLLCTQKASPLESQGIFGIIKEEERAQTDHVIALVFQLNLTGQDDQAHLEPAKANQASSSQNSKELGIDVKYMAFISPAITIK